MSFPDDKRRSLRRHRTRFVRRRWWIAGSVGTLVIVLALAAWIGIRGLQAKSQLEEAVPLARQAQNAALLGDSGRAATAAEELAARASTAASLTSDFVWRSAEFIPWVGPNLEGMRKIAASVDRVASGAVIPLARTADQLDFSAFRPQEGRVDLAPLIALQQPVGDAADAVTDARRLLGEGEPGQDNLIGPLAEAREQLIGMLDETHGVVDGLDRAVQLVPAMLGQGGGRDILLLFQNNAELRSTGGIPGALALLHTDAGGFKLTQQANSSDFPRFDAPVAELPVETRALWGENTARYIQDVTFAPQFPIGASVAREMWARQFGSAPASVIAIDPVVLSYLLRATGPISLPTGDQLTADNAVQLLLEDVYARYEDPAEQDLFFAAAAASVLDAVSNGSVDPRALIDALVQAASERRILIWNADPAEQELLAGTTLAGELPVSTAGEQAFGVYLNDMTMSKMDAYLDVQLATGAQVCREDGLPQYEIEVTLTNTAPADAATSLPAYVLGGGSWYEPGVIATSVHVYSAPGTFNLGVTQGGQPASHHPTSDSGYTLSKVSASLAPGESTSWRFGFLGDVAEKRTPVIQSTPMIYENEVSGLAVSCDSSVS